MSNPTTIKDEDIYWQMNWGEKYPNKPATEMMFEESKALARLLAEDVVFINNHWWKKEWPEEACKTTGLFVNCNDIFAWACAEGEEVSVGEIQDLYDLWIKDNRWGPAKWCAFKRNEKPQNPVVKMMKKDGVWDEKMEGLGENFYDKAIQKLASKQYV